MFQKSFRVRLILGAVVWITIALGISAAVLVSLLRDVVATQFDHDLSDHAEELYGLIDYDSQGIPFVQRSLSDPRSFPARSGFYWQIKYSNGRIARSLSLGDLDLPMKERADPIPQSVVVIGPTGPMRLFQRQFQSPYLIVPVQIGIGVDERLVDEALVNVKKTLALSLVILGLGLICAAGLQVYFGLRPLARVRQALTAIRTGVAKKLPDDLPEELAPLVNDLNALIAANNNMVRRARVQAGNLAHALKTSLAILTDEGQELQKAGLVDAGRLLIQQCGRMQRQIDYQVARARAVKRVTPGMATNTVPIIKSVIETLSRLHQDRSIIFEFDVSEDFLVACDPEDFSEMMGNLIDNAVKWAKSKVIVSIQRSNSDVRIVIEDDGPGVPPEFVETVFEIGERLDERKPGSGLGLAITRDLTTLYGGQVWIDRSELGGAAAVIVLPMAS